MNMMTPKTASVKGAKVGDAMEHTPIYAAVASTEPEASSAVRWWEPQRNVWTPVGWPSHFCRFNVLYNGTLIAEPAPHWTRVRAAAEPWLGRGLQLDVIAGNTRGMPALPNAVEPLWRIDGGVGDQGWDPNHETPVLWTDQRVTGDRILRHEIFSHLAGGMSSQTGVEPHFAWMRIRLLANDNAVRLPVHVGVRIAGVHCVHGERHRDVDGVTIDLDPSRAAYHGRLRAAPSEPGILRLVEAGGAVRLSASTTDGACEVRFMPHPIDEGVYLLEFDLCDASINVDLLVPMLPCSLAIFDAEAALGRDGALAQADVFWSTPTAERAAIFRLPERSVHQAIARNRRFAKVMTERDPLTGDRTFISGSWCYDRLSATPTSMLSHMFLDPLGHHELVADHVELFRRHQGRGTPPGPGYASHPGYLSTPPAVALVDVLTDHGAILHQVSVHALLSGDAPFLTNWIGPIVAACEFIQDACARTDHGGIAGLLPPGVATGGGVPMQAVWTQAWHYKGLTTAIRLLRSIGHPRAEAFAAFARRFRETFIAAFRERTAAEPTWVDAAGQRRPRPATVLSDTSLADTVYNDALYLDAGPLVLVWAGLLDPDDELMRATRDFFGPGGPNAQRRSTLVHPLSPPVLEREISSCEPCYSWNLFHHWRSGDRGAFLTGFYALITGAISPQTFISAEHRHGVSGNLFTIPLVFQLARLALIDDELVEGELHLLRLCPLAWIKEGHPTVLERIPTVYGPINLRVELKTGGSALEVDFSGHWRGTPPPRIILHLPPLPRLPEVRIDSLSKIEVKPRASVTIVPTRSPPHVVARQTLA